VIEVGHTEMSPRLAVAMTVLFLAVIFLYPLFQFAVEMARGVPPVALRGAAEIARHTKDEAARLDSYDKAVSFNGKLLADIQDYEKSLEETSLLREYLLPPAQGFVSETFKLGNEKAYVGKDGWLFYRSEVEYLSNLGFLSPDALRKRKAANVQGDPIKAILDFQRQLADRGVALVVVPVSGKAMIYPDRLSGAFTEADIPLQNPSFPRLVTNLRSMGVLVFDPAPILAGLRKSGIDAFLLADTHWTPRGMAVTAAALAAFLREHGLATGPENAYQLAPKEISGRGDIAAMLRSHIAERGYPAQNVTVEQVLDGTALLRPKHDAQLLLLGDSFSNIFSLDNMGWGEAAGFPERLAYELRRPIDAIVRNDAGSHATRELLAADLKKGRDRLAGKKVVVWEFAARELADGDWRLVDMALGTVPKATFLALATDKTLTTAATVQEVSIVPRPGSVPYKDHVMSLLVDDLAAPQGAGRQALVYALSMKDNRWTAAATLRPGDKVTLKLSSWGDFETEFGGVNRSEIENEAASLEEPCWGEVVNGK